MQNATTLPINDLHAFAVVVKVLTASSPARGVWSLPLRDKFVFAQHHDESPVADTATASALSATALLEQRAVPSRIDGCREVFGLAVRRQSRTRLAGRTIRTPCRTS